MERKSENVTPKLSIVVRAYNQAEEVIRALSSIVEQNVSCKVEIVIGVDYSIDNTLQAVKEFCKDLPSNFVANVIAHPERVGGEMNFVTCMKACTGEYVAFCDGDDYYIDKDKSKKQIEILDNNPNVCLVYGNYIIESPYVEGGQKKQWRTEPGSNPFTTMLNGNYLGTNITMFRGELLQYVEWDVLLTNKWPQDDYFLWLEIAHRGDFYHMPDFLAVYTVTRHIDDNTIKESCEYDVTTTQMKEYYIRKYPTCTDMTVDVVWNMHYKDQFRSAVLINDYLLAKDAVDHLLHLGKVDLYYRLLRVKIIWRMYMIYRKKKFGKRKALEGYF